MKRNFAAVFCFLSLMAHRLSYADCFAAALAKVKKSALVTGDKEFKSLEGEIKVTWLG